MSHPNDLRSEILSVQAICERLPKVELHLHLEGAIPLPALWALIEKYDGTSQVGDIHQLEGKFAYIDFPHFIETWLWKNRFIREYEDFAFIASHVAEDLANQNIIYVEAFYSPGDFAKKGLSLQGITEAIRQGLDRHKDRITVNLVTDLIRDFGPEHGQIWLEQAAEVKNLGVIGVGIGGSEQLFPPEPYAQVYERARDLGLRTSAHAGEVAGPESVWGAVRTLQVDRIGHATHAVRDPQLVDYLKEQQIPLEMCPISNLKTGSIAKLEYHPIKQFYDQGLMVTVNTDDPKMFNTNLVTEYMTLIDTFGFELDDIVTLIKNGIKSAWCDSTQKQVLTDRLKTQCGTHFLDS